MAVQGAVDALVVGGEVWVKFVATGQNLDFSGEDLTKTDLNSREYPRQANFENCKFNRVELNGSTFQKGATFKKAKFHQLAEIRPAAAKDSLFDGVRRRDLGCVVQLESSSGLGGLRARWHQASRSRSCAGLHVEP